MELNVDVRMRLTPEEMFEAVAMWAAKRMPVLDGYHVKTKCVYSTFADVYLVRDAEPAAQEGGE